MAASRWRVCTAWWSHALMLPTSLFVLIYALGNLSGVVSWVMALAAGVLWWLGILRDHAKDDIPYLQKHIQLLRRVVSRLDAAAAMFDDPFRIPGDHPARGFLASRSAYAKLLACLEECEKRSCQRLRVWPLKPQQAS